jgi:hypothetical protein
MQLGGATDLNVRYCCIADGGRSQVNRIFHSKHDITLSSLQRAAALVGRRVAIELVG